jgi:ActR/RegA family two-component response regulator
MAEPAPFVAIVENDEPVRKALKRLMFRKPFEDRLLDAVASAAKIGKNGTR